MKPFLAMITVVLVTCFFSLEAISDIRNVHIEIEGKGGGKGVAISRGLDCFVLTAAHVVKDPLPINIVGAKRKRSTAAVVWSDPKLDLALVRVEKPTEICGNDFYIDVEGLAERLEHNRSGSFTIRNEAGSEYEIDVRLTDRDNNYIYVEAESPGLLGERLSGSMLYVAGQPAGILVTVSTGQNETGSVSPIDQINKAIGELVPLVEPPEEQARHNDQLAADILRKHVNYMQTEDFCRNLWRLAKWVAKPDWQVKYVARRRSWNGGAAYLVKSMLFPNVKSLVEFYGPKKGHRSVDTKIGFIPDSMDVDKIWSMAEGAIDKCYNSNINKKIGNIVGRSGLRRNNQHKQTEWRVERTGFLGMSMEDADIWLSIRTSGDLVLGVWAIDD